jgi:site-specific recombinase XerD
MRGPLARYAPGFEQELGRRGYAANSVRGRLKQFDDLSRWLERRDLTPGELTPEQVDLFLRERRVAGNTSWVSPRSERLPLPEDVGTALAAYLRHSRPACADRRVFLRVIAPAGALTAQAINTQIRLIARRAFGFHSPQALISLAMLKLGGLCPPLPGRVTVT